MPGVTTVGLVFAAAAALIHVYIFVLESLRFDQPATWKVFGVNGPEAAEVIRPWAFNQGFYNLFLGLGAALGVFLCAFNRQGTTAYVRGAAIALFCCAVMVAAALVLLVTDRRKARAALVQGLAPALAVAFLLVG